MTLLNVIFIVFIVTEALNVLTLYFFPGSRRGNGIGVFNGWEKSKGDPEVHELVKYLVYWVAGTKLIFIALLIVILFTGSQAAKTAAAGVMVLSILSFFWRLFPIIRKADNRGEITPKGYSKVLGIMITVMVLMFGAALTVSLIG